MWWQNIFYIYFIYLFFQKTSFSSKSLSLHPFMDHDVRHVEATSNSRTGGLGLEILLMGSDFSGYISGEQIPWIFQQKTLVNNGIISTTNLPQLVHLDFI